MPENILDAYIRGNIRFPQMGSGIYLHVLCECAKSNDFDFQKANKYKFNFQQKMKIYSEMLKVHKKLGISPKVSRLFILFAVHLMSSRFLSGVTSGIKDYFKIKGSDKLRFVRFMSIVEERLTSSERIKMKISERYKKVKEGIDITDDFSIEIVNLILFHPTDLGVEYPLETNWLKNELVF